MIVKSAQPIEAPPLPDGHEYLIVWKIEVTAPHAEDALQQAVDIMLDRHSTATVFEVSRTDTGERVMIDLHRMTKKHMRRLKPRPTETR